MGGGHDIEASIPPVCTVMSRIKSLCNLGDYYHLPWQFGGGGGSREMDRGERSGRERDRDSERQRETERDRERARGCGGGGKELTSQGGLGFHPALRNLANTVHDECPLVDGVEIESSVVGSTRES